MMHRAIAIATKAELSEASEILLLRFTSLDPPSWRAETDLTSVRKEALRLELLAKKKQGMVLVVGQFKEKLVTVTVRKRSHVDTNVGRIKSTLASWSRLFHILVTLKRPKEAERRSSPSHELIEAESKMAKLKQALLSQLEFCIRCGGTDSSGPNKIVICDRCGMGFHFQCLTPMPNVAQRAHILHSLWYCPPCAITRSLNEELQLPGSNLKELREALEKQAQLPNSEDSSISGTSSEEAETSYSSSSSSVSASSDASTLSGDRAVLNQDDDDDESIPTSALDSSSESD